MNINSGLPKDDTNPLYSTYANSLSWLRIKAA
jgi:hypothetical protein